MKRKSDPIKDLHRLLDAQKFESLEELQKFMEEISKNPIPEIPEEDLTPAQRAEDMVAEAFNLAPEEALQLVREALKLDPDCIDAYVFLAYMEDKMDDGFAHLEKGIEIGRRQYGGKFMQEHAGHFWAITETRPFMRCMQAYAELLYFAFRFEECVDVLEEMVLLNPSDNQGVRYQLLSLLIIVEDAVKFRKYDKIFKWDTMAGMEFTRALFTYEENGPTALANKRLAKAIKLNPYMTRVLLKKEIRGMPDSYSPGSLEEAESYAIFGLGAWAGCEGAFEWLKEQSKPAKKKK